MHIISHILSLAFGRYLAERKNPRRRSAEARDALGALLPPQESTDDIDTNALKDHKT